LLWPPEPQWRRRDREEDILPVEDVLAAARISLRTSALAGRPAFLILPPRAISPPLLAGPHFAAELART
jgi:hypothetical protein